MSTRTEIPEHCRTRLGLRVRFVETDQMGVVHHSRYLAYAEAGRVEYLRRRGADYRAFVESGYHMPIVEAHLEYKRPALFDDEIVVEVRVASCSRVTLRFDFEILRAEGGQEVVLCRGHTVLACVDARGVPRRMPAGVAELLLQPERES